MRERRVNVVNDNGYVVSRVRYNSHLDHWNGRDWSDGNIGRHLGITKLRNGEYVLIYGTQWQGERDRAEIVSDEEALQAILKSGNGKLLDTKKYRQLKELYEWTMDDEDIEEHEKTESKGRGRAMMVNVYDGEQIIGRVEYNNNLDYWDGGNLTNGGTGYHLGITKLKSGTYVLIRGSQWQGEGNRAYTVTDEEALQAILRSENLELLELKKYDRLKALYESSMDEEAIDEE